MTVASLWSSAASCFANATCRDGLLTFLQRASISVTGDETCERRSQTVPISQTLQKDNPDMVSA